jgi:septal ring factor EnvC (AmiA/AmiB activator)
VRGVGRSAVRWVAWPVLLVGWLAISTPSLWAESGEAGQELEQLRQAIGESRDRVGTHERRERALFDRLEKIDRSAAELVPRVRTAREVAEATRDVLTGLELRAERLAGQLSETRRSMAARAVALYKTGEVGPVRLLFSSSSMADVLSRISVLRRLVEYDAELVARFESQHAALEAAEREAREGAAALDRAVAELAERSRQLVAERVAKRKLLAEVREDRVQERALLIELEKAARALEEVLAALGGAHRGGGDWLQGSGFAQLRGHLMPPVQAPISRGFGKIVDAQFQTETYRTGVEFEVAAGDSVKAVAPGQVRFADWFRGYGRLVIIDHGDQYFTVSGHLAEIFVSLGDVIAEGDTIGSSGETGSLTGPSLYFEIRRKDQPLDPAEWLAAVATHGDS